MKILLVHNSYQQNGGEDEVFASERDLLRSKGHEVVEYVRTNDEIRVYGIWNRATLGLRTVWAWDSVREMRDLLKLEKPKVRISTIHSPLSLQLCTPPAKRWEYQWFNLCTTLGSFVPQRLFIATPTSARIAWERCSLGRESSMPAIGIRESRPGLWLRC